MVGIDSIGSLATSGIGTSWQYYLDGEYLAYCQGSSWNGFVPVLYFDITEQLFEPYKIEAVIVLAGPLSDDDLGDTLCIGLGSQAQAVRIFVGYLWQFRYEGGSQQSDDVTGATTVQYIYRVWLRHPLANLGIEILYQIEEGESKSTIITNRLSNANIDTTSNLVGDDPVCNTNTQYGETTLDYIIRLMQECGFIAWFDSSDFIATNFDPSDSSSGVDYTTDTFPSYTLNENIDSADTVTLSIQPTRVGSYDFEQLIEFKQDEDTTSAGYMLNDYNFKTPETLTSGSSSNSDAWQVATKTVYPTNDTSSDIATDHANILMNREITRSSRFRARTTSFQSAVGMLLSIDNSSLYSTLTSPQYFIEKTHMKLERTEHGWEFVNYLEGVEYYENYACERTRTKPKIYSQQTAIVTGTSDNTQINVDSYGRIQVKFIWSQDTNGSGDFTNVSNPSGWARLMHWGSAGNGWGNVCLPRVGQEVVVGFLNGDPDHPIILGSVYNGSNSHPYSLPDNNSTTVMRTRTTGPLGDTGECYNEFKMVDTPGDELISFRAQHNYSNLVLNDVTNTIGGSVTTLMIGDAWTTSITKGSRYELFGSIMPAPDTIMVACLLATSLLSGSLDMCTINVGVKLMHVAMGAMALAVDIGDLTMAVPKGIITVFSMLHTTRIGGEKLLIVGGGNITRVGGDNSLTVAGDNNVTVDGVNTVSVAGISSTTVEGEYSMTAVGVMNLTADETNITSALAMSIEAGGELSLKAASISITSGDFNAECAAISLTSAAALTMEAGAMVSINAAMVEIA